MGRVKMKKFRLRIVKWIVFFPFIMILCDAKSQNDSIYSFYVAGHAYGAHAGTNIGLHPPLLKKLNEYSDSVVMGIFLTGDIVNQSTTASWNQVEKELSGLGLNSFYVMGNHDDNSIGHEVFRKKHGGLYYYFVYRNDLFIVLNSTESDRSISTAQLAFLDGILSGTDSRWDRAFIFFHEVIWNSNEKYRLVRSNSRSRYSQLVNISNFWTDVYPRLTAQPEKKFYLFSGDVGGNTDAIAAFFDRWDNVTLLSSGMGEVKDENFMKVNVLPDTVTFQLIPLNNTVEMKPVTWYNIPEKPDTIFGPEIISASQSEAIYHISPIENATKYRWNVSSGISGSSNSAEIDIQFNESFKSGKISVTAVNDGFGESGPAELEINRLDATFISGNTLGKEFNVYQNQKFIQVDFNSDKIQPAEIKFYDSSGKVLFAEKFCAVPGLNSKSIIKKADFKGLVIIRLSLDTTRFTRKFIQF